MKLFQRSPFQLLQLINRPTPCAEQTTVFHAFKNENPTMLKLSFALSLLLSSFVWLSAVPCSWGQENGTLQELAQVPGLKGAKLFRHANSLYIQPDSPDDAGEVTVPRIAAPLRNLNWLGTLSAGAAPSSDPGKLSVTPEQEVWAIRWSNRPSDSSVIQLEFDAAPLIINELSPVAASGDGSFWLPAHLAVTSGEKIRYEPQSFKNTVGYWVGKQDQATWTIELPEAGKFNVAILQGCGGGQGGSQAQLEFRPIASDSNLAKSSPDSAVTRPSNEELETSVEFEVVETGHFQNFQWRHLDNVELQQPGRYEVRVRPLKIKNAALMDIRAIHLVRLPE